LAKMLADGSFLYTLTQKEGEKCKKLLTLNS